MRTQTMRAVSATTIAVLGALGAATWLGAGVGDADTVANVGLVPAHALASDPAERAQHGDALDRPGEHLLVSLADAASGRPVEGVEVTVALRDPRGRVQSQRLVPGRVAGIPDYSGVFAFGWSGRYRVHVSVEGGGRTLARSDFTLTHEVRPSGEPRLTRAAGS